MCPMFQTVLGLEFADNEQFDVLLHGIELEDNTRYTLKASREDFTGLAGEE